MSLICHGTVRDVREGRNHTRCLDPSLHLPPPSCPTPTSWRDEGTGGRREPLSPPVPLPPPPLLLLWCRPDSLRVSVLSSRDSTLLSFVPPDRTRNRSGPLVSLSSTTSPFRLFISPTLLLLFLFSVISLLISNTVWVLFVFYLSVI